jgi:hypothetical protein
MTLDNWKDNSKWFDVKFLVDVHGVDKMAEMVSDGYADHVKAVLTKLALPTNKLRHLGRGAGTKELDGNEVNEQEIHRMGQWNHSNGTSRCMIRVIHPSYPWVQCGVWQDLRALMECISTHVQL